MQKRREEGRWERVVRGESREGWGQEEEKERQGEHRTQRRWVGRGF